VPPKSITYVFMQTAPIFVLGAALTDLVGFPQQATLLHDSIPGRVRRSAGGVGRNLADNLSRLGLPVELVTAFGEDDNGRNLLKACQAANIGVRHSILAEGYPGARHLAILNEQNDLLAGIADMEVLTVISPAYLEQQMGALSQARLLCVETNLPANTIDWLLDQDWEMPLYLDPVSAPLSQKVTGRLGRFHTVKANLQQASVLAGFAIKDSRDLAKVAHQWLRQGVQRICITLGADGAFVADQQQQYHLTTVKVNVANTTGAGDAFFAGFIWATQRNWSLDDCCRAGLAASAIAVRAVDAINPELSEISLLEWVKKLIS
ncbi:MAG: carbohydrate kinase family protein, partial [Bacteroidota bacterium]